MGDVSSPLWTPIGSQVCPRASRRRAARMRSPDAREAIDTLKQTVPLWKKEVYEGGEE